MPSKASKPELPDGEAKPAPENAAPGAPSTTKSPATKSPATKSPAKPAAAKATGAKPAVRAATKTAAKPAAKATTPQPKPAAKASTPKPKPAAKPAPAQAASKPAAAKPAPKPVAKSAAAKPARKPAPKPAPKPAAKAKPAAVVRTGAGKSKPSQAGFDAAELAAIRESLLRQRGELQRQLTEIEEATFNASQSEMSGEVSYDEDYADAGSFTFEREKDLSIANNVTDLRSKIDRALHKIDDGTYGICETCGNPIEGPRLKALPHVTLCLKCKKAEERR